MSVRGQDSLSQVSKPSNRNHSAEMIRLWNLATGKEERRFEVNPPLPKEKLSQNVVCKSFQSRSVPLEVPIQEYLDISWSGFETLAVSKPPVAKLPLVTSITCTTASCWLQRIKESR